MNSAVSKGVDGPAGGLAGLVRAWNHFWFNPADPTLLGVLRICCGLVTLYVHLAYTVDLQELMGPNAWVDLPTINNFREEYPWQPQRWDWKPHEYRWADPNNPAEREKAQYMQRWEGGDPGEVFQGYWAYSIWYHVTDPTAMWVTHVTILVIMFLFTIGCLTRITSVLTWVAAVSYLQRSPTSLFGQDTMMNILLLYLMIGPSGAALSVDRLIRRYWLTWRALRKHQPAPVLPAPAPRVSANLAVRLMQVNLCLVYGMSALSKLMGGTWWSCTALHFTLANYEFSPMRWAPYAAFLRFICEHRMLWEILMTSGVAFTFLVELGFPFLVWNRRLRVPMLLLAMLMHTGIALSMSLRTFSLMMIVLDLSFVPPEVLQRLRGWLRRRQVIPLQLRLGDRARGQVRAASVIHALDGWEQVAIQVVHAAPPGKPPIRDEAGNALQATPPGAATAPREVEHLELITPAGDTLTGYPLFERVVRTLPLLWPVALWTWVPGVAALGKSSYPGADSPADGVVRSDSDKRRTPDAKVTS